MAKFRLAQDENAEQSAISPPTILENARVEISDTNMLASVRAACGIDCNACALYKITMHRDVPSAEKMIPVLRDEALIGENDGVDAVFALGALCRGCRAGEGVACELPTCPRLCCIEKGINNCGLCAEFPCRRYDDWVDGRENRGHAKQFLLELREGL